MMTVLVNSSLTDSLTDALRKQIVAGEIEPGDRLSEHWVADRFQVARPTAKAGLDRLTNEGLLRRGPRRSATVPRLTSKDVVDLYFSREPIESCAVEVLARTSDVPLDAQRSLALMRLAAEHGLHADHTEADVALHRALVRATGSERLQRMHETVMGETQLCIAQVRTHAGLDLGLLTDRHALILEAIGAGDPAAAVEALRADLHSCRDTLVADIALRATRTGGDTGTVDQAAQVSPASA